MPNLPAGKNRELKEKIAETASHIGESLREIGSVDLSVSYHEQALALRKELFGERHPDVADVIQQPGIGLLGQGRS